MTVEKLNPYQERFVTCTEKIQSSLVKGLQSNLDETLTSSDQMGCTIISLTNLIRDLVTVIASGSEEDFSFKTFLSMLNEMNEQIERGER